MRTEHEDKQFKITHDLEGTDLIRPTPDLATAAFPTAAEEKEAEAHVILAQAELDKVRAAVVARKLNPTRPSWWPPKAIVKRGDDDPSAYQQDVVILRQGEALEIDEAERNLHEAHAALSAIQDERRAKIQARRVHLSDEAIVERGYVPTDPRFKLVEAPRPPAEPISPEQIAKFEMVAKLEGEYREIAGRLATRPNDRNLQGQLEDLSDKIRLARVTAAEWGHLKAAKARAKEIAAQLAGARALAEAAVAKKRA